MGEGRGAAGFEVKAVNGLAYKVFFQTRKLWAYPHLKSLAYLT